MSMYIKELSQILEVNLVNYKKKTSNFFNYLYNQSKVGFTARQFLIYRDNYFYRTYNTIPSVAKVVVAAYKNLDSETIKSGEKNLADETGGKTPTNAHSTLLYNSHNHHAKYVFDIPPISLEDSYNSPYVLEETKLFQKIQNSLYESNYYCKVLAVSLAQESAAHSMIKSFYETFFIPYKAKYSESKFIQISNYFNCHIQGLEEEHSKEAFSALVRNCKNVKDIHHSKLSIIHFLNAQAKMWNALHNELKMNQDLHEIVRIN